MGEFVCVKFGGVVVMMYFVFFEFLRKFLKKSYEG